MNFLKTVTAATLLLASLSSSAAIIEVSYEGVITSNSNYNYDGSGYSYDGDGAGYNINDVISGSLFIDTDMAPNDYYSQTNLGYYHSNWNGNADFVTGFDHESVENVDHTSDVTAHDYVYFQDDYSNRDYFAMYDYETSNYNDNAGNFGHTQTYVGFGAYSEVDDFISTDSLMQSFTLTDFSSFTNTWGTVYSREYDYENNQVVNNVQGYSNFKLTSLSYNTVSEVPEPSSIAILALGLFGLFARKRSAK